MHDRNGAADAYLELLKGALTHSLYGHADRGIHYRRNLPARALFALLRRRDIVPIRVGPSAASDREEGRDWPVFAQTMVGRARLDNLRWAVEEVLRTGVQGDLIEAGVWRGGASIFMRGVLKTNGAADRTVWACDSFAGLPRPDPRFPADGDATWHSFDVLGVSLEEVKRNFERYGLLDDNVRFVKGWFSDTLPKLRDQRWALIRLDADMYESTTDALTHLYPNLSPGGFLVVDDYTVEACRKAVHAYRDAHGVSEPIQRIDWASVYWQRAETGTPDG